jgi:NAD(P)-dependent dehydrogenase (short-subunit alcohol dehydrogenase family)
MGRLQFQRIGRRPTGGRVAIECVIVTGGASGIGLATAEAVVKAGGHVALLDMDGEAASEQARQFGDKAIGLAADVTSEAALIAARTRIEAELPPVTGLVNCAAALPTADAIEDLDPAAFDRILLSHVSGTLLPCRVFGGPMAERRRGAIVNLASVLAYRPGPILAYGAGKAGVVNLTESLATHWAKKGVRVNAVAPGWTDTPFISRRKAMFDTIRAAVPMGRLLEPSEIAAVILFLLSPAASAVTGTTIPCDGGYLAGAGWGPYGGFPKS